jgi:hypothetical protein
VSVQFQNLIKNTTPSVSEHFQNLIAIL